MFMYLCWPLKAFWACIEANFFMFMHLHHLCSLLHVRSLTKCPSDIFVLNWTLVSSNTWILSWLIMLIMFWSVLCDVYTLGPICASLPCLAHTQHASCISCCIPMHHMLHTHAPSYALPTHTKTQVFKSCIMFQFTWLNTYSMLFCVYLLCFELFLLCLKSILLRLWTNMFLIMFCVLFCVSTLSSLLFCFPLHRWLQLSMQPPRNNLPNVHALILITSSLMRLIWSTMTVTTKPPLSWKG